jgi:RimJ/RimL family protein N-acetyltransferase
MKYFPKMMGSKVFLSPISLEDAERYTAWLNDLSVTRFLTLASTQISLHGEREHLESLSKAHNYAIVEKASGELLGNCGIMDIDETDRSAEVGIFIGEEAKRGKGYGTEALTLLCDYAFNVLGLHNLMLRVAAFNGAGQASYRKIGFKEFGRRHGSRFYAGGFHDMVYMELLAKDFGPSRLPGLPGSKA